MASISRRRLGRTALECSAVGLGTWRTFDTAEDRTPIVEAALATGINLLDSSPMYGRGEEVMAKALGSLRQRFLVATKVWAPTPQEARAQIDHALALFGRIDIYQVHNLLAWEVQLAQLERLKQEGRVGAVGATVNSESDFPELIRVMRTGRLDMVQIPYNPLRRQAERELLPLAQQLGLGVLTHSPLQRGILRAVPPGQLEALGVRSWAEAVLKWVASDLRVTSVLTATSRVERVCTNARAGTPPFFAAEQRQVVTELASAA